MYKMLTKPGIMENNVEETLCPVPMLSLDHKGTPFFPESKRVPFPSAPGNDLG